MRHITDEEIFRLIDGECQAEEQVLFQAHINHCIACKVLYAESSALNTELKQIIPQSPSAAFTDTLMEKWQAAPAFSQPVFSTRSYSLMLAPLAFIFGLILIVLSGSSLGWFTHTTFPVSGNRLQIGYDLGSLQNMLQNEMLLYLFLVINAILALLILDKMLLRPYFRKKINQMAG